MKKIASFQVNHDTLKRGMYISRIDGDIVTYDLRMREPNKPPFIENDALHTLEHLFATFARNSAYADKIIYFGPMGCRTGCYFLVRDTMSHQEAIRLVQNILSAIAAFEGDIPGAAPSECGNWKEHDLIGAKKEAEAYAQVLSNWKEENLSY